MKLPIKKLVNNTGQIEGVPANPRQINKDSYQKLLKSLQDDPEFLDHKPLHVYQNGDKYVVLGGNQRLRALRELKYTEVPVTVYKQDTPVDILKGRVIKDNTEFGEYDWDIMGNEWSDEPLSDWGVDTPDDWLKDEQEVTEDEAPEVDVSEPPKSKTGEIYQLGRHRVMCADSTVKENVEKLMDGNKADMVFTDPPYGMNLDTDYTYMKNGGTAKRDADIHTYERVIGDDKDFDPSFILSHFSYCKEVFLWGADYYCQLLPKNGGWLVWDKTGGHDSLMDSGFGSNFELCWSKRGHKRDVIRATYKGVAGMLPEDGKRVHPTQKSIPVCSWFIKKFSKEDDMIVDLFLGSGSTLIACEQTDRTCFGMELDPKYVDVVRRRYHKFVTGSDEGWENGTPAV